MQSSKSFPGQIIISFIDSILQSILILVYFITLFSGMFTQQYGFVYSMLLPGILGIIQLISAVVRMFDSSSVTIRIFLYRYWFGVLIAFLVMCWIGFDNSKYVLYTLMILSGLLAIGYCCLSWYHSFYLSKKTNHVS